MLIKKIAVGLFVLLVFFNFVYQIAFKQKTFEWGMTYLFGALITLETFIYMLT